MSPTGSKLLNSLPDSIRVACYDISIVLVDSLEMDEEKWGQFSSRTQTIIVQKDMPSESLAKETLVHEIFHAIYWSHGLESGNSEEDVVWAFGIGWGGVIRDNPWLLDWLGPKEAIVV